MKILYDYPGFERKVSGAARYFLEIIKGLDSNNKVFLASKYVNNIDASKYFKFNKKFLKGLGFKGKNRLEIFLQRKYANKVISKGEYDFFHATGQHFYFKDFLGEKPLVVTVHDLIYELIFREGKVDENRLKLYERANKIITISHHTKADLLKLYPSLDPNKISVIYHGVSIIDENVVKPKHDNYILFVGTRKEEYKNFTRFVKALVPLLQKDSSLKIACTGLPFTEEEKKMFHDLGVTQQVVNVGFVSDAELYGLYQMAKVFVFPSYYEGFGIPILESYKMNCPICISNASCFPEIAGDAASYFDPFDEESILDSVSKVIENPDYADELRDLGKKQLELYSWGKTVEQTEKVYKSLIQS